jgi:phospholipase/lecithinase/hemolysin
MGYAIANPSYEKLLSLEISKGIINPYSGIASFKGCLCSSLIAPIQEIRMLYPKFAQFSRALVAGTLPLALVAVAANVAQAFSFSSVYVFGDSLVDSGNTYARSFGLIPPPPYFPGRASNGPVWVEYLAPELGLTYNPATNFAFAGATSGTTNTLPFSTLFGLPGLQQEVASYRLFNRSADPNGLYILQAGADDYLGNGSNPQTVVANLTNAIENLAAVGAKNFLISNLPDLGNLPGTRNTPAATDLSLLTSVHNILLSTSLISLSQSFGSSVNLIPLDVNTLFSTVAANPTAFGLTNTTAACINPTPSLATLGITPTVCSNPDSYLFWDDIHPTTFAHQEIASFAFSTLSLFNSPRPAAVLEVAAVPEPPTTPGLMIFGVVLVSVAVIKPRRM